jgi:hypothetical protein
VPPREAPQLERPAVTATLRRGRVPRRYLIWLAAVLVFVGAAVGLDSEVGGIGKLTRDAVTVAGGLPFWTSALSTAGLMMWAAAAAVCLLTASVLWSGGGDSGRFFLAVGAFIALLGLDDAYLFHEEVAPFHLKLPERLVQATYVVLVLALAWRFRRRFARSDLLLLGLALTGLALSLAIDAVADHPGFEDCFKLVGIGTLLAWCVIESRRELTSS